MTNNGLPIPRGNPIILRAALRLSDALTDLDAALTEPARHRTQPAAPVRNQIGATADSLPDTGFDMPRGTCSDIRLAIPRCLPVLGEPDMQLSNGPAFAAEDDQRDRPVAFVGLGRGPGRNVISAQSCGVCRFSHVSGYDIDSAAHDVAFSFRPFSSDRMQGQREAHIAATIRPGGYPLAPLSHDLGRYPALIPVDRSYVIWKKIT